MWDGTLLIDNFLIFKDGGMVFLSNLIIDSRPCDNDLGPIALSMVVDDDSVEFEIPFIVGRSK